MASQTEQLESTHLQPEKTDTVVLPRWAVYFQGAMLGIVATTFFVFGLMVGDLTSDSAATGNSNFDCRLSGKVTYQSGDRQLPDSGAVVMLLPKNSKPSSRAIARLLNPNSFQPLDNDGIDTIHELGGAVVRADSRGSFDVKVDGNGEYNLLVVSKHAKNDGAKLSKSQKAMIGTYVIPVEDLMDDRKFHWSDVYANSDKKSIDVIAF